MQNRFRSWALWLSVAALIVYVIKMIWGLDVSDQVNGFLDVLLPVLVAFGIVNNPTDREHF